jgi:hypothetical protein
LIIFAIDLGLAVSFTELQNQLVKEMNKQQALDGDRNSRITLLNLNLIV